MYLNMRAGGRHELFVDGSPGPVAKSGHSGWGVTLLTGSTPVYESCGYTSERLTSNGIELEALIHGLAYLQRLNLPCVITVWTDSDYVANSVANLPRIVRAGYCDAVGQPLPNANRLKFVYELLYELGLSDRCVIRRLKGHRNTRSALSEEDKARIVGNDIADRLSKKAAYHGEMFERDI